MNQSLGQVPELHRLDALSTSEILRLKGSEAVMQIQEQHDEHDMSLVHTTLHQGHRSRCYIHRVR